MDGISDAESILIALSLNCHLEFPAVLLNATTGQTVSEFHRFVRPTNHPTLSSYCLNLTGITQQQIDRAKPFPEVFREFMEWLDEIVAKNQLVFFTSENRQQKIGQNTTFCSWSSFDLRHYFELEMVRHKIDRPDSMAVWIDFQHEFQVFVWMRPTQFPFSIQTTIRMAFSFYFAHLEEKLRPLEIRQSLATHEHSARRSRPFGYRGCTKLGQTRRKNESQSDNSVHISKNVNQNYESQFNVIG